MLISAMLWYNKFRSNLENIGFEFNPYNPCVANRIISEKQHTIRFHVDNLLSSHVDSIVNNKFHAWLEKTYGKHGKVKTKRGKIHDFLGMKLNFSTKGKMVVDMRKYMKKLYKDFEEKYILNGTRMTQAAEDLFSCLLYTSPSPRDKRQSRMPSSA